MLFVGFVQAQPTIDVLVNFLPFNTAGANPYAGLTLGKDGNFYGTTAAGNAGVGTVFKVTTSGILTTLTVFNYTNGANPFAALTLGKDGDFYSTTFSGGINGYGGYGTVFKVTTNGTLTTLVSFNGTNGASSSAALTLGNDGCFYGTTQNGGNGFTGWEFSGSGTVFRVTTNGKLTTLVNFDGANGIFPSAGLTLGCDGNLYGTTSEGGIYGYGTIFKVTNKGILTTLANLDGTNGAYLPAGLTLGKDGNLYGTTEFGGSNGFGTVFQVTTKGKLTTLANFNGINGAYPDANLTLASDGCFYGTTFGGGHDNGNIFKVTTNGTLTALVNFNGINGSWPMAPLAIGKDGNFYGTTEEGGIVYNGEEVGVGTVFKLIVPPTINYLPCFKNMPNALVCGLPRSSVQIQTTTCLSSPWSVLTNLDFTSGTNQFIDRAATNSQIRFYRVMVQ